MIRADLAGWALLLIAIAIAYFVALKASKEGSSLFKLGGYTIAVIILVISLFLAVGDLARRKIRRMPPRRTRRSATTPRTQQKQVPKLPADIQKRIMQQQAK